jgi:hypothetical protein
MHQISIRIHPAIGRLNLLASHRVESIYYFEDYLLVLILMDVILYILEIIVNKSLNV